MLILTDRAKEGQAIHDYLSNGRHSKIIAIHQGLTYRSKNEIIICDVDITNITSLNLLKLALEFYEPCADTPTLFITRDSSPTTNALALSLGATESISCTTSPVLIRATADRLIYTFNNSKKAAMHPASATEARANEAKASLDNFFGAVKRGKPVSVAELDKCAGVVLAAVKKSQVREWLDVVWQFDDVTYQHCLLVTGLVAAFSLTLSLTPTHQNLLTQAALIHDIGKAKIPLGILNKAGPLSSDEMEVMRTHAALGHAMLAGQRDVDPVILDVIRHHHEYPDGSGYPDRLRGRQISGFVRVVTICDIYAALIERRSYKSPMSPQLAFGVLRGMGDKLDRDLLKGFEAMLAVSA